MEAAAKKPKVGNDLTQGSIYKTLIVFAVPIILTNLIQQLYSMVDLMVIGQFVGSVGTVSYTHLDVYKRQAVGITRATSVSEQTDGGRCGCLSESTTKQASPGVHPPAATPGKRQSPFCSSKPMKSAHRAGAIRCP